MSPIEKEKIARFLEDNILSYVVYQVLMNGIIDSKIPSREVNYLAAERIALDILRGAWEDLRKYKAEVERKETDKPNNVGL